MPSNDGRDERGVILVVHRDRKTQRTLHRILGATLCTIDAVETVGQASKMVQQHPPALVVLDYRMVSEPGGRELVDLASKAGTRGCVLLVSDGDAEKVPQLFTNGSVTNLLTHSMPILAEELTATALKLLRGELFGLEKYMAWGVDARTIELSDVAQRPDVVDTMARDVRELGLGPRVASMSSLVADELLSNALFDAPVDPSGQRVRMSDPRHEARALEGRDRVTLRYACDARYLAIEVTDQYGSLDRDTIVRYLAKASERGPDQVDLEGAGAGMGLALTYSCCTHLVFNLAPQRCTQAIGLIDVRFKPAQLGSQVPSFNVFVAREAS